MRLPSLVSLVMATAVLPCGAQETHLILVEGAGGGEEYRTRFHTWAGTIADAALGRFGLPRANLIWLAEKPEDDPGRVDGPSRREDVEAAFGRVADRAGPDDQVFIVLVGHGSYNGGESRFNLPGRDLTPTEFALLLEQFPTQKVGFANTASASGGFVEALSGPNRTIVAATRSPRERNATLFGGFFAEALSGDGADTDKDGRVSLLEAFVFARRETARHYDEQDLLATEHAILDDNGDGQGSDEPNPESGDGALARAMFFSPRAGAAAATANPSEVSDPELRALYEKRARLEERIAALRGMKEEMKTDAYEAELEELLVDLALTTRAIREKEGGSGG